MLFAIATNKLPPFAFFRSTLNATTMAMMITMIMLIATTPAATPPTMAPTDTAAADGAAADGDDDGDGERENTKDFIFAPSVYIPLQKMTD